MGANGKKLPVVEAVVVDGPRLSGGKSLKERDPAMWAFIHRPVGSVLQDGFVEKGGTNGKELSKEHGNALLLDVDSRLSLSFAVTTQIVEPPVQLAIYLAMLEKNTRLRRSVYTYARNVAGLGFTVVAKDEKGVLGLSAADKAALDAEIEEITDKLNNIGSLPFTEILLREEVDEETMGQGYLEIIRNGSAIEMEHVPGHTIKALQEGGYIQEIGIDKVFFKKLGDRRDMSADTGELRVSPNEKAATELLQFKIYSPISSFYGQPRWAAAAHAVTGNWMSAERNNAFFDNDTVPRMAVLVSGGRLDSTSLDTIKNFFKQQQGPENAHRVIVLQTEQKSMAVGNEPKGMIELKPLTIGMSEDAGFLEYRKANDDEILEAFGIHKAFFTSEDVNKANGEIGRQITNEQEFKPARENKEFFLNKFIMPVLGAQRTKIVLNSPEVLTPDEKSQMDARKSENAELTVNEARMRAGLPPLPEEHRYANLPWQVAKIIAQADPNFKLFENFIGVKAKDRMPTEGETGAPQETEAVELEVDDIATRLEKAFILGSFIGMTERLGEKMARFYAKGV